MTTTRWQPRPLDQSVREIEADLATLSGLAVTRLAAANRAWTWRDRAAAQRVIADDARVDALCAEVESAVFHSQLLHAPVARNARLLHVARIICVALERVGNLASAIATVARDAPRDAGDGEHITARIRLLQELAMDGLLAVEGSVPDGDPELAQETRVAARRAASELAALMGEVTDRSRPAPAWAAEAVLMGRHLERVCDNAAEITQRLTFVASPAAPVAGA